MSKDRRTESESPRTCVWVLETGDDEHGLRAYSTVELAKAAWPSGFWRVTSDGSLQNFNSAVQHPRPEHAWYRGWITRLEVDPAPERPLRVTSETRASDARLEVRVEGSEADVKALKEWIATRWLNGLRAEPDGRCGSRSPGRGAQCDLLVGHDRDHSAVPDGAMIRWTDSMAGPG